jgi:glutathione S-transferase
MSDLHLYSYAACPFAQRTRITLLEKGLAFELTEIDINSKPQGWENISPYGKVPLLQHAGGTIYESGIINEYLDEAFPAPPLMPDNSLHRAQARIWIDYCDSRFLPACMGLAQAGKDAGALDKARDHLHATLLFIEQEGLQKTSVGPFWFGSRPGLIDFHFAPFLERFGIYEELWDTRIPDACTRIKDWDTALKSHASVQATARELSYHVEQYKKRYKAT